MRLSEMELRLEFDEDPASTLIYSVSVLNSAGLVMLGTSLKNETAQHAPRNSPRPNKTESLAIFLHLGSCVFCQLPASQSPSSVLI